MHIKPFLLYIMSFISIIACLSGCSNKTYSDDQVYFEKGIKYEKKSKQPINGLIIRKFKSGEVYIKSSYKNGLLDGKSKNYFITGELQAETNYKNGKRHGEYVFYTKPGVLAEKSNYNNGIIDGPCKVYMESGKCAGKIDIETNYKNGKKESEINYVYDDSTGVVSMEKHFKKGKPDLFRYFYKNVGKIEKEILFDNSDSGKIIKTYNINGNLGSEEHFLGKRLIKANYYSFDGKLIKRNKQ